MSKPLPPSSDGVWLILWLELLSQPKQVTRATTPTEKDNFYTCTDTPCKSLKNKTLQSTATEPIMLTTSSLKRHVKDPFRISRFASFVSRSTTLLIARTRTSLPEPHPTHACVERTHAHENRKATTSTIRSTTSVSGARGRFSTICHPKSGTAGTWTVMMWTPSTVASTIWVKRE